MRAMKLSAAMVLAAGATLAMAQLATLGAAELLKSGPQVGDSVGAFQVVKAAGAEGDGVAVGDQLCYRCKMGNRPMVMIFAHKADESLAKLAKKVDAVVAENSSKKMGSFVNLLGDKSEELKAEGAKFVQDNGIKHIAIVVPKDQPNGPADYSLSDKAEVTVLIYRQGTVVANFAIPAGGLTDETIKEIVDGTNKILN
jgi:hypothetical protein